MRSISSLMRGFFTLALRSAADFPVVERFLGLGLRFETAFRLAITTSSTEMSFKARVMVFLTPYNDWKLNKIYFYNWKSYKI